MGNRFRDELITEVDDMLPIVTNIEERIRVASADAAQYKDMPQVAATSRPKTILY